MTAKCKSCGAEIIWARTSNGHAMPLNAKPTKVITLERPAGNTPGARIVGDTPIAHIADGYTSHFANCPQADDWRKQ